MRVAMIADGLAAAGGTTHPLAQLRERGIPGHEIEVIGIDPNVARGVPAAADLELDRGFGVADASPFDIAEALTEGRYDLLHVFTPTRASLTALAIAREIGLPVVGSHSTADHHGTHHPTDPSNKPRTHHPTDRPNLPSQQQPPENPLAAFYAQCTAILSPGPAADAALTKLGTDEQKIRRWQLGVDLELFHPARYCPDVLPGATATATVNVLHVGPLGGEHRTELLAESFLLARDRDPRRLHLVLAGHGPEVRKLRARLANAATFLGGVEADVLARLYASADLLVFTSSGDPFCHVILEAQAGGLPVLAVDAVGPADLIESGRSGCLVPPDPEALASALRSLARRPAVRDRLSTGGLLSARARGWQRSLEQLAAGWRLAIDQHATHGGVSRAA